MRLLVTGAGGLIGRHVVELAAKQEIAVTASARQRPPDLAEGVEFAAGDLSDEAEAAALVRSVRPTHIIHAAWVTHQPTYWEDPINLEWVAATLRLAQAFAESHGQRFVQLGSCAEYDWSYGCCDEESTPTAPATLYGKAKVAAFQAVRAAGHNRYQAVEARMFMVYGPGENPERFIPTICRNHVAGTIPDLASGTQLRDWLYVKDAARALLALALAEAPAEVVNIGSGEAVSLGQVAAILARLAGAAQTGLGRRPDRPGDPHLLTASTTRLRMTGWRPAYDLETGLRETLSWWRNETNGA
ncbi:MAG: NAD(P)-dependent oxidoreductase [Dongiaceae bacterium]